MDELKGAVYLKLCDLVSYVKQNMYDKDKQRLDTEDEKNRLKGEIESIQRNFIHQRQKVFGIFKRII